MAFGPGDEEGIYGDGGRVSYDPGFTSSEGRDDVGAFSTYGETKFGDD
jgi:hypothetical protein